MDYIWRRSGSRWASRKGVALLGTVGAGICLLCAYAPEGIFLMIALLTASTFCAGMAGPAGYTITIDQGGHHLAMVFSIMNTAGNIGATLVPVAVGAFAR